MKNHPSGPVFTYNFKYHSNFLNLKVIYKYNNFGIIGPIDDINNVCDGICVVNLKYLHV